MFSALRRQVVIQEGPGWVIDAAAYEAHLRSFDMDSDRQLVYRDRSLGRVAGRCWLGRTLLPPCPALPPSCRLLDQALQAQQTDMLTEAGHTESKRAALSIRCPRNTRLADLLKEATGPSNVVISTDTWEGDDDEPDTEDLRPRIKWNTSRRAFNAVYRPWCLQNNLVEQEILEAVSLLSGLNVAIKKARVSRVKGIRLRSVNQVALLEELGP
ncbi:uncharacterized protein HaLaN_14934 [Haematococcus lacustris]|uniref:Uncharacterized protein n=1 Tax=Haematococcus lacustris TaxID=44745 RepID=A0A699ZHB9_HAELA|nr:uncharacterized protein HaLaN_14934 [Haematococcus lacustris]